jgi:hypothetical protein
MPQSPLLMQSIHPTQQAGNSVSGAARAPAAEHRAFVVVVVQL